MIPKLNNAQQPAGVCSKCMAFTANHKNRMKKLSIDKVPKKTEGIYHLWKGIPGESNKARRFKGNCTLNIKKSIWISIWASRRDRGTPGESKNGLALVTLLFLEYRSNDILKHLIEELTCTIVFNAFPD